MSKFRIEHQDGFARILVHEDGAVQTPMMATDELVPVKLSEDGAVVGRHSQYIPSNHIPEFAIITPYLFPPEEFKDSLEFEFNLMMDRMDEVELPRTFGVALPPSLPEDLTSSLLKFSPSIVAIRAPPLDRTPPKNVIEILKWMNELIPPDIARYLPAGVPAGMHSLAINYGVDIFSDASAAMAAMDHELMQDGFIRKSSEELRGLLNANKEAVRSDLNKAISALMGGYSYSRMHRDYHTSPTVASVGKFLRKSYPIPTMLVNMRRATQIQFISDTDLSHPVVSSYMERVLNNYTYPEDSKVLLLLPCSAKKPYRNSRSHKFFNDAVRHAFKSSAGSVEIWSLTSPLGVVPRELESVYPAGYYDIPVSGDWSELETNVMGEFLKNMIRKVPKDVSIIVHTSEGYRGMIEPGLDARDHIVSWIGEKPSSREAISSLKDSLFDIRGSIPRVHKSELRIRSIRSLLRWNYGAEFEVDLDELKFIGRPPRPIQAKKGSVHWLSFDEYKARPNLSLSALETSNFGTTKKVRFDGDAIRGSSVFAPGILSADESISPGDEVLIMNDEATKFMGVGIANVSGGFMNKIGGGVAVSIRKKYKNGGYEL